MIEDQRDMVCGECPLGDCDEESLWCIFRFLTSPNDAQRRVAHNVAPGTLPRPYHTRRNSVKQITLDRREYFAERYRRKRLEKQCTI